MASIPYKSSGVGTSKNSSRSRACAPPLDATKKLLSSLQANTRQRAKVSRQSVSQMDCECGVRLSTRL